MAERGINGAIQSTRAVYQGSRIGSSGISKPHFKLHTTAAAAARTQRNANRRKSMGGKGG